MKFNDKIFVAFESTDFDSYKAMKEWKTSEGESFDFYDAYEESFDIDKLSDDTVKMRMHEKMQYAKVCIILIGAKTKSFRKFIRWQIEYAINANLPIIAININGIRSVDFDRCPTILKKTLSIHITYQAEILEYALKEWITSFKNHKKDEDNRTYRYKNEIYDSLGLHTSDLV